MFGYKEKFNSEKSNCQWFFSKTSYSFLTYLFTYYLFNDGVIRSYYIASNNWLISNEFGSTWRTRLWPMQCTICPEGLRKTTKPHENNLLTEIRTRQPCAEAKVLSNSRDIQFSHLETGLVYWVWRGYAVRQPAVVRNAASKNNKNMLLTFSDLSVVHHSLVHRSTFYHNTSQRQQA
jgi:hypothetical protein